MAHTRILKGSQRWHRVINGVTERLIIKPGQQPPDHTWTRGMGETNRELQRQQVSRRLSGVPKTPEHKQKMREAKLGVPKTPEHRAAMSKAHQQRHAVIAEIMLQNSVTWIQARQILKQQKTNK